ncbi:MAG: Gfo/Idh/MocA family oxidoreductase [Planctomycetota bacterium]|nr:Gfo/Idh/MocA family oxidoreductase [Planctomycetota bacterium]
MRKHPTRRQFVSQTSMVAAGLPWLHHPNRALPAAERPRMHVERAGIAAIGMRYQGSVITEKAKLYGDIVAIADVDRHVREQARASFGSSPRIYENYRDMLDNPAIDVVLIGAPDHWHTRMLIDAVAAGKDVYCEKPLTLTIDEGKVLRDKVGQSDQVVQVGTWQRSDSRFRRAVEMVRQGRIGKLRKVTCNTDKNPKGGPFQKAPVPSHINWDLWQGQTPDVPYIPERCHYTFRWWMEYSGGKMTDWGAHHIDIAQWAIDSLPVKVTARGAFPEVTDGYNVPTDFAATIRYANGVELQVADQGRRGILFEGDQGRIFVNRGALSGAPVEALADDPLPRDKYMLYAHDNLERQERSGKLDAIINHMGNFFDCIDSRQTPISDLESQHRSVSTCHLVNIAIRVQRPLDWDPVQEVFRNDPAANAHLKREQRQGFEIG